MKTTKRTGRFGVAALGLLVPTLFLSGCGGGSSPLSSALTGTYSGRYALPAQNVGGNFVLRVQSNGSATGIFDEDTSSELSTSGSVNSNGRISLKGSITRNSRTAKFTITGDADTDSASGDVVVDFPEERNTGTFSLRKTSSASTTSTLQGTVPSSAGVATLLERKLDASSSAGVPVR